MATICKCGGIRKDGNCNRCGTRTVVKDCRPEKERRPNANSRGYDYRWQKFRERFLIENPLCLDCKDEGRLKPSHHIHHIVKLSEDPGKKFEADNLMALCATCHDVRTARGE